MAALYWVGALDATFDGVTPIFATSSGGLPTVAAVTNSDDVNLDSNSPAKTLTIGAAFSCNTLTINKAGATVACDGSHGITAVGAVTLTAGTLNTGGQTCSWGSFATAAGTKTLTLGASALTVTGSGTPWNTSTTTFTFSANTATITFTGAATLTIVGVFGSGTSLVFTGTSAVINNTNTSLANFTLSGQASKVAVLQLNAAVTCTGTVTLGGNSTQGVNRLLVQSNTVGTSRTITAGSYVITGDVDFMDINLAYSGGASWTNAGSAFIGDCGGNSGAVTTNATGSATQTATGTASFTWSTHGWTSRVPLPQDDVSIPNAFVAGRTVTADMPRLGRTITSTCSGSPTLSLSNAVSIFGGCDLTGITLSGAQTVTFAGRSSYSVTTGGTSFSKVTVNAPSGTLTLADDLRVNSTGTVWTVTNGTIAGTGIVTITDTSSTSKTFAGGGKTYGGLRHTATGSAALTITGNNTFTTLDLECTTARTITLPANGTQTITQLLRLCGPLSIVSSTPGTPTTLACAGAIVSICADVTLSADIVLTGVSFNTVRGSGFYTAPRTNQIRPYPRRRRMIGFR